MLKLVESHLPGALLFAGLWVGICAAGQTTVTSEGKKAVNEGKGDALNAYLQHLVDDGTMAGAVVLVADRNRILTLEPVGYRDLAAKAPMKADSLFWIASTTKPMTATAFMMLVDEGKVNLDDPVEKYLPEFHGQMVRTKDATAPVPAAHPIKIREILSHTSGLPFKSKAQPGALDLLPLKDAVKTFAAEPLNFQPGTSYAYSNEGLNTAARILEVVSGRSYEQFLQEKLFDPLGMKDTTFWPNEGQVSRIARSYKADPTTKGLVAVDVDQLTYPLNDRSRRYPMPAGGLFSTASDVAKFCQMILNGGTVGGKRLVSEAAIHEMTKVQNGGMEGKNYGLGWAVDGSRFGHGGAYNNDMEIDPDGNRIVIFMVQQSGAFGTAAGKEIMPNIKRLTKDAQGTLE